MRVRSNSTGRQGSVAYCSVLWLVVTAPLLQTLDVVLCKLCCLQLVCACTPLLLSLLQVRLSSWQKMTAKKLLYYMYMYIIIIMHVQATVSDVQSNWGTVCHMSDHQLKVIIHTGGGSHSRRTVPTSVF